MPTRTEWEDLGELGGEADPLGKGSEESYAPKGRHRFIHEDESNCLGAIQRGNLYLHRFVPPRCVVGNVIPHYQIARSRTMLFYLQ